MKKSKGVIVIVNTIEHTIEGHGYALTDSLDKFLKLMRERFNNDRFTVYPSRKRNALRVLEHITTVSRRGEGIGEHYVWRGGPYYNSITICQERLVSIFGSVPKFLSFCPSETP